MMVFFDQRGLIYAPDAKRQEALISRADYSENE